MAGLRRSWTTGGGVLILIASGSMVRAEDLPFVGGPAERVEAPTLAAPIESLIEPQPEPADLASAVQAAQAECLQCQPSHPRRVGRFLQRLRPWYWGTPDAFHRPPLGAVCQGQELAQIGKGHAARMVLYQYDFLPASADLNPRGKLQVARIAMWLSANGYPVIVEASPGGPELDELRRQAVWRELDGNHCQVSFERVIAGRPDVRGLDGGEAILLDRNRLGLTSARGISAGGGGSSASGVTGANRSRE